MPAVVGWLTVPRYAPFHCCTDLPALCSCSVMMGQQRGRTAQGAGTCTVHARCKQAQVRGD